MMRFGLPFYTLLHLTLHGPVLSRVWVNQWSTLDEYRVGDTATLHCAIFSDKETIEDCDMEWAMLDPNNPDMSIEIRESKLYAGRVSVQSKDDTTTVIIQNLGLNDTAPLCIIDCFLDGRLKRKIGQGGSLKIVELSDPHGEGWIKNDTEVADQGVDGDWGTVHEEESLAWLSYFLFAVNLLIFLVVTVICSTIMYRRLLRK
ncbi:uncharacterized protein LOC118220988 [Anguilla anguilla]|uniref:uncharacterized protein LOC118220988 n=1 Tax=Anguilla anguilla TaxID=7936 RepID=UPI0015AC58F1|nr:uncharacterized protein LOC118220988 [Anguilla anguilla]